MPELGVMLRVRHLCITTTTRSVEAATRRRRWRNSDLVYAQVVSSSVAEQRRVRGSGPRLM
jgi:hypothetical protein